MKHFWALPALVRLSLVHASQHSFSVHDDLLAFPQYRVGFSDDYLTEAQAQSRLASNNDPIPNGQEAAPSEVEHYQPQPSDDSSPDDPETPKKEPRYQHERMLLHHQPYLCAVPQIPKPTPSPSHNSTTSRADEKAELARANSRGWELLHAMQDQCIYFVGGWWSYKFCYGQGVKQFHQLPPARGMPMWPPLEDPGVGGFVLGKYAGAGGDKKKGGEGSRDGSAEGKGVVPEEAYEQWEGESALEVSEGAKKVGGSGQARGELVSRGDTRYLVQKMDGGTMCDLTGKPRRIEIQYHCHPIPSDRISLIKETSTCAYLMVIQTPRLCNDIAFQPPVQDQPNEIVCNPILHADEIPQYELDLAAARSAEKAASLEQARLEAQALLTGQDPSLPGDADSEGAELPPQMVGGILIGGHKLVPKGSKIEKSALVGGGKEVYVDTVANSDGKLLDKKKREEYGLGDEKDMKRLAEKLEEAAAGAKWRLEVIDTPRGREYRGIIGDEEEEGKKGGKGKGKGKEGKDGTGGQEAGAEKKTKKGNAGKEGDVKTGDLKVDEETGYVDDGAQEDEEGSEEEFFYKEEL